MRPRIGLIVICGLWVSLPACKQAGSRIHPPSIDIEEVAAAAMQMYDANGDGGLDEQELQPASSIVFAMEELDADGNKVIDAIELASTLRAWADSGIGLTSVVCQVTLSRKPLADAEVVFEPESFYHGAVLPAFGISDRRGYARMVAENAKQRGLPDGMQLGFYKVRISKIKDGKQLVPTRYNEQTELGRAVSSDDRRNSMVFVLRP